VVERRGPAPAAGSTLPSPSRRATRCRPCVRDRDGVGCARPAGRQLRAADHRPGDPGFAEDRADVGGTRDTWSAQGAYRFYHGKPGTRASFNGFRNQFFIGTASGSGYITNSDTIGEMQVEIAGMGAENGSGSTTINAIPREGSNTFTASVNTKYSGSGMQAENLTPELKEFGIEPPQMVNIWRAAGTIGGPILTDKLWYYGSIARWGRRIQPPGGFFNALQGHNEFGLAGAQFPDMRMAGPHGDRRPVRPAGRTRRGRLLQHADHLPRARLEPSGLRLRLEPDPRRAPHVAGRGAAPVRQLVGELDQVTGMTSWSYRSLLEAR